jgi:adenylosuccinate lyase
MKVWEALQRGEKPINEKGESLFLEYLLKDNDLKKVMKEDEIKELFDYSYYTRNVDKIYKRVYGE